MEHLSAILKNNNNAFYDIWQPFLDDLLSDLVQLLKKGQLPLVFTNKTKTGKSLDMTSL